MGPISWKPQDSSLRGKHRIWAQGLLTEGVVTKLLPACQCFRDSLGVVWGRMVKFGKNEPNSEHAD